MSKATLDILENIIRLSELLDEQAVKNIADVPFLELAKNLSVRKEGASASENRKANN